MFSSVLYFIRKCDLGMAKGYPPTPELLDTAIDSGHRSFQTACEHKHLTVLQSRPPAELLRVDDRWIPR